MVKLSYHNGLIIMVWFYHHVYMIDCSSSEGKEDLKENLDKFYLFLKILV
jgi:hypothetical protein